MTLEEVLKYSADSDWHQLVQQMDTDPQHQQAGAHLRLIAAEAADDLAMHRSGEDAESLQAQARLLRSNLPIYLWRGGVYHAEGGLQGAENFADIHERHHFRYTPNPNVAGEISLEDSLPTSSVTDPQVSNVVRAHAKHYYHSNFSSSLEQYPRRHSRLLFNYTTPHSDGEQYPDYVDLWPGMGDAESLERFHQAAQQVGRFTLVPDASGRIHIDQDQHHWGQPAGIPEDHQ